MLVSFENPDKASDESKLKKEDLSILIVSKISIHGHMFYSGLEEKKSLWQNSMTKKNKQTQLLLVTKKEDGWCGRKYHFPVSRYVVYSNHI